MTYLRPISNLRTLTIVCASVWAIVGLALAQPYCPGNAFAADAGPDMLLPGEKVRVTLAPGGESLLGFAGVSGGRWTIVAKPVGKSTARPTLDLVDPTGDAVDLTGVLKQSGRAVAVKGLILGESGTWRVSIRTPPDSGGDVDVSVVAKLPKPLEFVVSATTAEPGVPVAFPGLPLASCSVTAALATKSPPGLALELRGPGGGQLATGSSDARTVQLKGVLLTDAGTHEVLVRGGPGEVRGKITSRPPKPRKGLVPANASPPPVVTALAPASAENDQVLTLNLTGFGFLSDDRVLLKQGVSTRRSASIGRVPGGAQSTLSLDDLPPGDYSIEILTVAGRTSVVSSSFRVNDQPSRIDRITPVEMPNGRTIDLAIDGAGFDVGTTMSATTVPAGGALQFSQVVRANHRSVTAKLVVPVYQTGQADLRLIEGGQPTHVRARGLEFIGRTSQDVPGTSFAYSSISVNGATNTSGTRALLALWDYASRRVTFALIDTGTGATIASYAAAAANGVRPRCAYNPADSTWAATWVVTSATSETAYMSTLAESNLAVIGQRAQIGAYRYLDAVEAIPRAAGGYRLIWTSTTAAGSSTLQSMNYTAVGGVWTSLVNHQTVTGASLFLPTARTRPDGLIVIGYYAIDADAIYMLNHVIDIDGAEPLGPPAIAAFSSAWENFYDLHVAVNPSDGSGVMACTVLEGGAVYPVFVPFTAIDVALGTPVVDASDGIQMYGYLDDLAWNPARAEFLGVLSSYDNDIVVRRLNTDGTIRPAFVEENYEGLYGRLLRVGQTLRVGRNHDGTDDGRFDFGRPTNDFRTFRIH